jgi:hypothetical protein
MKKVILIFGLLLLTSIQATAQTEFVLEPSQSMIMTGKGPGQDATINPFYGETCIAIVKNIGELSFTVRIQQKGKIIRELSIEKGESKNVELLRDYELYLDPNPVGISKASINYKKYSDDKKD